MPARSHLSSTNVSRANVGGALSLQRTQSPSTHAAFSRRGCGRRLGNMLAQVLGMVFSALLLAGCDFGGFFADTPEVPLDLDYNRLLPAGWSPITQWYEVNIDGDNDIEYLLLFTYDAGQVGAVIYDQQVSTDLVAPLNGEDGTRADAATGAPLQAFGYYRPYLLLPSNWDYTYGGAVSHGFVAHPSDAGNIVVSQMVRVENVLAEALGLGDDTEDDLVHPGSEVVIQGGGTHLTFVWWKNRQEGYGVTQLYAPGGFRGLNWATWREAPVPIDTISGLFPLTDYRARSLLCQETAYARRGALLAPVEELPGTGAQDATTIPGPIPGFIPDGEASPLPNPEPGAPDVAPDFSPDSAPALPAGDSTGTGSAVTVPQPGEESPAPANGGSANQVPDATADTTVVVTADPRPLVAFGSRNLGIKFCTPAIPAHPFYPEGVTLAYLLGVQTGSNTGATQALVTPGTNRAFLDAALDEQRLEGERVNDIEAYPTVPVSLDMVRDGDFAPTTSVCLELTETETAARQRWLLFTLRYHAPDMEARTAERWTIAGVAEQPPPPGGGQDDYCRAILGLD